MSETTLREIVARASGGTREALAEELGPLVLIGPRPEDAERPSVFQYTTSHARRSVPSPIEQLLDGLVYRLEKRPGTRLADKR